MRKLPRSLLFPVLALVSGTLEGCDFGAALEKRLIPATPFDAASSPSPPDYGDPSNWAALPDREDLADVVPAGSLYGDTQASAPADVFYIHPTSYYRPDHWNMPLDDPRGREITDKLILSGQASAFNACCRVYAPRYRQATLGAFAMRANTDAAVFDLAYADVVAAWHAYLERLNDGRPFVVASHSQGSLHAMRLLGEIANSPARERLVAAYVVGYQLPRDLFEGELKAIPPCAGPRDTGCVVAWDTFSERAAPALHRVRLYWKEGRLQPRDNVEPLCTNPISWTLDGAEVPSSAHRGALSLDVDLGGASALDLVFGDKPLHLELRSARSVLPGITSARCEHGRLLVPELRDPRFRRAQAGKGNYHLLDYGLFWEDLRGNAVERVRTFTQR
jgi:hypothetical protein